MIRSFRVHFLRPDSWPLVLAIVTAGYLFRGWYFSLGYLTFGDIGVVRSATELAAGFHLWNPTIGFGFADSLTVWYRFTFDFLYLLHASEPLAERIIWLYAIPPLLISGTYLAIFALTHDRLAAGVAALAQLTGPDFFVRAVGGHVQALPGLALAPWVLWFGIRYAQTRNSVWLPLISVALFLSCAYDGRWAIPTFLLTLAVVAGLVIRSDRSKNARWFLVALAGSLGAFLANFPWLLGASLGGGNTSPAPAASNYDPSWISRLSDANLFDALAGWNPTFINDFSNSVFTLAHLPWYGVPFIFAVLLSVVVSRRRLAYALLCAYVGFAFLFKGDQPPFGALYVWLFEHVPLFGLYREPLKFGYAVTLCAALLLGMGVAHFSKTSFAHNVVALGFVAAILALSAHAFVAFGGTLVPRAPNVASGAISRSIQVDRNFGRVLWLPRTSRWAIPDAIHPAVDGALVAQDEWSQFTPPGSRDNGLPYVRSRLFNDLLAWSRIRYVCVDFSVQDDATFRDASFSSTQIVDELKRNANLEMVANSSSIVLFRVRNGGGARLFSAANAAIAFGDRPALAAASAVHAIPSGAPVILHGDEPPTASFDDLLMVDDAAAHPHAGVAHRIVGSDAIDEGSEVGSTIIDRRAGIRGRWHVRTVIGRSTAAFTGTIAMVANKTLRPLRLSGFGTVLADGGTPVNESLVRAGGFLRLQPVPMYLRPQITLHETSYPNGKIALFFRVRERASGRSYAIVGPTYLAHAVPRTALDVRRWIFEMFVRNPTYDAMFGRLDRYDALELTGVGVFDDRTLPSATFSLNVSAAFVDGLPVSSMIRIPAAMFQCADCTKRTDPVEGEYLFRFGPAVNAKRILSVGSAVSINTGTKAVTGVIDRMSPHSLHGISLIGTDFSIDRRDITRIGKAPDLKVLTLERNRPIPMAPLIIRVKARDPLTTVRLAIRVGTDRRPGWLVLNVPNASSVHGAVVTADLLGLVGGAGYEAIREIALFVTHPGVTAQSVAVTVSNAYIIGRPPKYDAPARLFINSSPVRPVAIVSPSTPIQSTLGASAVPVAVDFSNARGVRYESHTYRNIPSVASRFFLGRPGDRWLVFDERFDPGWRLFDGKGKEVGKHMPVYGMFNAWYVERGLAGTYRIEYAPDRFAMYGIVLSSLCILGLIALAIALGFKARDSADGENAHSSNHSD